MKIQIKFVRPNLIQESMYSFKVSNWLVKGRLVAENEECHCNDKDFDTYIETDKLTLTEVEIKEMVKTKLGI